MSKREPRTKATGIDLELQIVRMIRRRLTELPTAEARRRCIDFVVASLTDDPIKGIGQTTIPGAFKAAMDGPVFK